MRVREEAGKEMSEMENMRKRKKTKTYQSVYTARSNLKNCYV